MPAGFGGRRGSTQDPQRPDAKLRKRKAEGISKITDRHQALA
jgi:hypothetical protein